MRIQVVFLGGLPHGFETHSVHLELAAEGGFSVGQLRERLGIGSGWAAAIARQTVPETETLNDGVEIAFFSPMEGG